MFATRPNDVLQNLPTASTTSEINHHLSVYAGAMGAHSWAIVDVSAADDSCVRETIFARNDQTPWARHHAVNGYGRVDPVWRQAIVSPRPIRWADAVKKDGSETGKRIINEASAFDFRDGIALCQHSVNSLVLSGLAADKLNDDPAYADIFDRIVRRAVDQYYILRRQQPHILTLSQQRVLHWVAQGKSNNVIAEICHIAESTVKFHLKQVMDRLGVSDRAQAVAVAKDRGLL